MPRKSSLQPLWPGGTESGANVPRLQVDADDFAKRLAAALEDPQAAPPDAESSELEAPGI
eukprot:scaffold2022_cov261-Pinguiococcus_pyrenoidosus.AAC.4